MKRYHGNETVRPGVYLNARQMSFKSLEEEGALPGTFRDEYRRVPTVTLLIVGPLLGGLYAIFLPLIGFGMVAWFGIRKVAEVVAHAGAASARVLSPAWQPARAFLSRGRAAGKARKRRDKWAEKVKKELRKETEDRA